MVLLAKQPIDLWPATPAGMWPAYPGAGYVDAPKDPIVLRELSPQLLRVSKLIHHEAAEVFYGRNLFRFTRFCGYHVLASFLYTIGDSNVSRLKHITVYLPTRAQLDSEKACSSSKYLPASMQKVVREHLRLQIVDSEDTEMTFPKILTRSECCLHSLSIITKFIVTPSFIRHHSFAVATFLAHSDKLIRHMQGKAVTTKTNFKMSMVNLMSSVNNRFQAEDYRHALAALESEDRFRGFKEAEQRGWAVSHAWLEDTGKYKVKPGLIGPRDDNELELTRIG